jgi:hypothetical protein
MKSGKCRGPAPPDPTPFHPGYALLQISALIYGVYIVYQARPAFIVFTIDRFEVVAANEPASIGCIPRTVQDRR